MLLEIENIVESFNIPKVGVFHIGAHHGQEIEKYKNLNLERVIMFEPSKKTFAILENNLKNESAILVNLGLGSEDSELDLHVESANLGMSNSLLKPALHTEQYPNIKFESVEKVKITTLDKWCEINPQNSLANIISLDVQGYELEVLLGAQKTLKNIDLIICEVNREELYKDCAYVIEIDTFLSYHGFIRVFTNWAGKTWGDAAYIKRDLVEKKSMRLPKMALRDSTFPHHKKIMGNESASYLFPTSKFQWDRENIDLYDFVVTTDDLVRYKTDKKKIAWLIEPQIISPGNYEYVKNHQHEFNVIVSHDTKFVENFSNGVYVPHGGTWISPESWTSSFNKSKNISIIASEKSITHGHKLRHLAAALIEEQHRFGRGYKQIESKLEALQEYRYSIVIENSKAEGYFSEKLIDCLLLGTVPIYWGSKSALDIFDSSGIIVFDTIDDLENILKTFDFEFFYKNAKDAIVSNSKKARRFASMDELFFIGLQGVR